MSGWQVMNSMTRDSSVRDHRLAPGTRRRVLSYAAAYKGLIAVFLGLTVIDSLLVVASPLLLQRLIDDGVIPGNAGLVIQLAVLVALIALADATLTLVERWFSSRIGEGLIYDLRTQVFGHVLRQPIAFFTRAQTGALVTRLNSDVIGAQQAFTSVLQNLVGNAISLVVIVVAMASLSWQLTLGALLLVPLFIVPARIIGRRLAGLTRRQMSLNAEMGAQMSERFNVAGALLVKLFGDPRREDAEYADHARGVRDVGVTLAVNRSVFFVALGLVASLATAMVYGFGGVMAVNGLLTVGTLLALAALLARLYAPLTALSNVRVDVMTALVSFERVFEVLDLKPLVEQKPDAVDIPDEPVRVEIDQVSFRYPSADEISLASLEGVASGDRKGSGDILHDITFDVAPGSMVALVGPSGAGKTTITSLHDRVGVVTQEAHLFHDTLRANLLYAKPEATTAELEAALRAAQVWHLVESLPAGLDTVVGDRGHRLSGGEKQRFAIARLLLKGPGLVVLGEATAHLDSESEAAVQRALDAALADRTSIVIAHRLSTVRGADQILVVDAGRIVERGSHVQLLAQGGLYADLDRTQFAEQAIAAAQT